LKYEKSMPAHLAIVRDPPPEGVPLGPPPVLGREARLRAMVDQHVNFVARVLRNAGTAEKGFLFKIALNLAAHARRTMARRREVLAEEAPERIDTLATPEALTDQKRMRQLLDGVLDKMDESLRVVFVLYEFEEMNMSEIADVLEIPRGTVASRLRRARAEFRERVGALEGVTNREGKA
jgi:RNA polymerase sigma-70 factor (ECF subfamily)